MDFLRSCYRTQMRLVKDSDTLYWVRWYFADPKAKDFGHYHLTASEIWRPDHKQPCDGIGESSTVRQWSNGKNPGYRGQCHKGQKEWFISGIPAAELLKPADPLCSCCFSDPDIRGGLRLGGLLSAGSGENVRGGLSAGGSEVETPVASAAGGLPTAGHTTERQLEAVQGGGINGGQASERRPDTDAVGVELGGRIAEGVGGSVPGGIALGGKVSDQIGDLPAGGLDLGGAVSERRTEAAVYGLAIGGQAPDTLRSPAAGGIDLGGTARDGRTEATADGLTLGGLVSDTRTQASGGGLATGGKASEARPVAVAGGPAVGGGTVAVAGLVAVAGGLAVGGGVAEGIGEPISGGTALGGGINESEEEATMPYMLFARRTSNGTDGGTNTANSWTDISLTDIVADSATLASLSGGNVTLPPGTYRVRAYSQFVMTNVARIRLYDVTNSAVLATGMSNYPGWNASFHGGVAVLLGRFTIATSRTVKLQYYTGLAYSGGGLGYATGSGAAEEFTSLELIKE